MCGWAYEGARDAQRAALEGGAGAPDGEEAVELGVGVELEELRVRPAAGAASARWDTALAAEGAASYLEHVPVFTEGKSVDHLGRTMAR